MFEHLGCPPDLRESTVGEKPAGLDRYSSSGVIPLLVHGDLVLTESRVMLEYLAEYYGFVDAYPVDLKTRSLHRHAMAVVDVFLAPLLFAKTDAAVDGARLEDALRILEQATASVAPQPHLLAMHIAPIWWRFRLWHPTHVVPRAIGERAALCDWLDTSLKLDCLTRTVPEPIMHRQDFVRSQQDAH